MNDILLTISSLVVIGWGTAHIIPTKGVVTLFGPLSDENRRILTMEWIAEGLALVYIGLLILVLTLMGKSDNSAALVVYRLSALMLFVLAGWTQLTGARTSILPIRLCPFVLSGAGLLVLLGSFL